MVVLAGCRRVARRPAAACFDPTLPSSVVRHGPYRVVRHPFYTSYMLFWIGWSVAAWSVWALPPPLVMLAIYILAARGEEGPFARSPFAGEYAAYRRQIGMFWPRWAANEKGGPGPASES